MDAVKNADGTWKVWDFRSDPPTKLTATSDFCIGRGTFGWTSLQMKKKGTTENEGKEAA